jgi:hypothetical protein
MEGKIVSLPKLLAVLQCVCAPSAPQPQLLTTTDGEILDELGVAVMVVVDRYPWNNRNVEASSLLVPVPSAWATFPPYLHSFSPSRKALIQFFLLYKSTINYTHYAPYI